MKRCIRREGSMVWILGRAIAKLDKIRLRMIMISIDLIFSEDNY